MLPRNTGRSRIPAAGGQQASRGGLHQQTLELLGLAICNGDITSGEILKIEEIEARFGVSKSVVREVLRVLEAMGLVESRRRVGVMVHPLTQWNLFDPQVIRWRLSSSEGLSQLRALTELRTAVEPEAARLAAQRATVAQAGELMSVAAKLWAAGESEEHAKFLELDIEYHRLLLEASGNEMFERLDGLVREVLTGRTEYGLMPAHPHEEALQKHLDVAQAIQRGQAEEAYLAMRSIVERAMDEMRPSLPGDEASGSGEVASSMDAPQ